MAISKTLLFCIIALGITNYCFAAPEPTTAKPEPESPKAEPEKSSEPSAEVIANYATLGVLLGACFIAALVFALLWWKTRSTLKSVQAQNQSPQKAGALA